MALKEKTKIILVTTGGESYNGDDSFRLFNQDSSFHVFQVSLRVSSIVNKQEAGDSQNVVRAQEANL